MNSIRSFIFVGVVAFWATYGHSDIITTPSELSFGDQYRLAFVTSVTTPATSTDISFYNDFVTSVAEAVPALDGLATTWSVIGSTAAVSAQDNTNTNPSDSTGVPIFLLNDTMLVDGYDDLWDGTISMPLNFTELGSTPSTGTSGVWTGTFSDGSVDVLRPLGSSDTVRLGFWTASNSDWIGSGSAFFSSESQHLYAISGTLTAVPEPSACCLLGGLSLLIAFRRKLRQRA